MTTTQRGQPTTDQVSVRIGEVWAKVPELPFVRFFSNMLAAGGYSVSDYESILFTGHVIRYTDRTPGSEKWHSIGTVTDAEMLRCLAEYEEILDRYPS